MRQAGDSRSLRLAAAVLAACLALALRPAVGEDYGFDPYVVSDIEITIAAEDAVVAKERALAQAVADGLERVLHRLSAETQHNSLPEPSQALAHRLLDRLSIESEQVGSTRYSARFRVAFSQRAVRDFLSRHGVEAVDEPAPPILLIPVLVEDETYLWWDDAEAWTSALGAVAFEDGLTPARLANNSRADREVDGERLLTADQAVLGGFRVRYRTQGVVAVVAETVPGRSRIALRLIGEDATGPLDIREDLPSGGLSAAAERVAALLSERWKSAVSGALVQQEPDEAGLEVRVLLHGGDREWREIERRLAASGQLRGLSVERMASQSVDLTIWPRGERSRLADRLAVHGLDLFEAGGIWLLQSY